MWNVVGYGNLQLRDKEATKDVLQGMWKRDKRVKGQKELSMKWYKFVIYFQFFTFAIFGLYHGFMRITGMQYGTNADQVYNFFGMGMRVLDFFGSYANIGSSCISLCATVSD